jgi:hypothetical protein
MTGPTIKKTLNTWGKNLVNSLKVKSRASGAAASISLATGE